MSTLYVPNTYGHCSFYMYVLTEAVKAILTYTDTAVELMRRRKMKRDILFQYLAECGVIAPVSADKRELIQKILSHWGTPAVDLSEVNIDTKSLTRLN